MRVTGSHRYSWRTSHHHAYHRHRFKLCRSRISLLAAIHARGECNSFFVGVTAGFATYHSGSGPIGAIIIGLIASSITFAAGQIAFTTVRSPLIRAAIALLFALPAAVAGYHAALCLAQIGIPSEGLRHAIALIGAIAVAATAWARIVLSAPPDTGGASLPASAVRLTSAAHDG